LPWRGESEEAARVAKAAARVRSQCDVFVVIGIGGSYLGARAAAEMCGVYGAVKDSPELLFAGLNISGTYHAELLDSLAGRDFCLCVISKSGTTTESNIAFAILKDALIERYGKEEAVKRIYAITDPSGGSLRAETESEGYESFIIPPDVGGR
jgi:glucose-6-phosphate isomerase